MSRLRQVRLSYPAAFVELSVLLACEIDKRAVGHAMQIPLSTLYRWLGERDASELPKPSPGWSRSADESAKTRINELIAECERCAFDVRNRLAHLLPPAFIETDKPEMRRDAGPIGEPSANPIMLSRLLLPSRNGNDKSKPALAFTVDGSPANATSRVFLARMQIDQRYYTQLSCDSLAESVGMTKFNFIKAFKSAFAVSPYQYLMQVRVDHARHMLALTDQPLHLIAAGVGFGSVSSLSRAFKRFAGSSPSRLFQKLVHRHVASPAVKAFAVAQAS